MRGAKGEVSAGEMAPELGGRPGEFSRRARARAPGRAGRRGDLMPAGYSSMDFAVSEFIFTDKALRSCRCADVHIRTDVHIAHDRLVMDAARS